MVFTPPSVPPLSGDRNAAPSVLLAKNCAAEGRFAWKAKKWDFDAKDTKNDRNEPKNGKKSLKSEPFQTDENSVKTSEKHPKIGQKAPILAR